MSVRQHTFKAEGLEAEPRELTEKDREIMRRWKSITGQCLWCLYSSDLWEFATFHRKRKGQTVSETDCRCPECSAAVKRKTLIRVFEMDMAQYGEYFWDRVFGGEYDKVAWDPLKARLREGFSYADVQPFWNQYWAHKELSLGGWEEGDDDEAYKDYVKTYSEGEDPQ